MGAGRWAKSDREEALGNGDGRWAMVARRCARGAGNTKKNHLPFLKRRKKFSQNIFLCARG